MAQFYFHAEDGRFVSDDEGASLESLSDARVEAVRMMGNILREAPDRLLDTGAFRLTVTDAAGLIYFALDVSATDAAAGQTRRRDG